jgi:uncharacterized protein (DUF58 family)
MLAMSLANDPATVSPEAAASLLRMPAIHVDRLVRQPVVVLSLATATALLVFVLATPRVLPMLGGLVAILVLGVVGPWLSLAGLRGRLTFDAERCRVGDRITYTLSLTRFGHHGSHVPRVAWPATATSEDGTLIPRRRGRLPTRDARPVIESDWPFGITTARKPIDVARPLVVRPVTTAVRFPIGIVTAHKPGRDASCGLPGSAGDVLGVRDYRVGDSIRSIHWTQTARQGDMVVCERPGIAAPQIRIVLQGDERAQEIPEPRLDAAVTIASSLVESWAMRGATIEVCWTPASEAHLCLCPRDRRTLDETLDTLACIEAVTKSDLDGMRQVDLEVVIVVRGDAHATLPQERLATRPPERFRTARRLVVAFEPMEIPDTIHVPASPSAAALLDKALAEIGHDPDTRR